MEANELRYEDLASEEATALVYFDEDKKGSVCSNFSFDGCV